MDPETWNDMKELERAILGQLSIAMDDGDPKSNEARKLVAMHRRWVGLNWGHEPQTKHTWASPMVILPTSALLTTTTSPAAPEPRRFWYRQSSRR